MTQLTFQRVATRGVSFNAELDVGIHVLLGAKQDGPMELLRLACGHHKPKNGRVLVDGQAPHASPELRRATGSLFDEELLALGTLVADAIDSAALLQRQQPTGVTNLLEDWGLSDVLQRRPEELSEQRRRAVALALALGFEGRKLLALWDPFRITGVPTESLREHLQRRRDHTVVLIATPEADAAVQPADTLWLLREGQLLRSLSATDNWDALLDGVVRRLRVHANAPGTLREALAQEAAVSSLELGVDGVLRVAAPDLEAASLCVMRAAQDAGLSIDQIDVEPFSLEGLQAAASGYRQAIHDATFAAAQWQHAQVRGAAEPPTPTAAPEAPAGPSPQDPSISALPEHGSADD
jgi:ABC-2 type transport system ATP-binding protein